MKTEFTKLETLDYRWNKLIPELVSQKYLEGVELDDLQGRTIASPKDLGFATVIGTRDGDTVVGFVLEVDDRGGATIFMPCRLPMKGTDDFGVIQLDVSPFCPSPLIRFSSEYMDNAVPMMYELEIAYYKYVIQEVDRIVGSEIADELPTWKGRLATRVVEAEKHVGESTLSKTVGKSGERRSGLPDQLAEALQNAGIDLDTVKVIGPDGLEELDNELDLGNDIEPKKSKFH